VSEHYPGPASPDAPVKRHGELVDEDAMARHSESDASGALTPEQAGLTSEEYEQIVLEAKVAWTELDRTEAVAEARRLAGLGKAAITDPADLRRLLSEAT
jgi:hypothetical protein